MVLGPATEKRLCLVVVGQMGVVILWHYAPHARCWFVIFWVVGNGHSVFSGFKLFCLSAGICGYGDRYFYDFSPLRALARGSLGAGAGSAEGPAYAAWDARCAVVVVS